MANNLNMSDVDKEKVKMFFSMLGEVVAMFISIFDIFKKKDVVKANENKTVFNKE